MLCEGSPEILLDFNFYGVDPVAVAQALRILIFDHLKPGGDDHFVICAGQNGGSLCQYRVEQRHVVGQVLPPLLNTPFIFLVACFFRLLVRCVVNWTLRIGTDLDRLSEVLALHNDSSGSALAYDLGGFLRLLAVLTRFDLNILTALNDWLILLLSPVFGNLNQRRILVRLPLQPSRDF
jgi:hypothetical protein